MQRDLILKLLAIPVLGVMLGGCPPPVPIVQFRNMVPELAYTGQGTVAVATQDLREYIVSGETPPAYIGQFRSLLGETLYRGTYDGKSPLAGEMNKAMAKALRRRGFGVTATFVQPNDSPKRVLKALGTAKADRSMVLEMKEWIFDGNSASLLTFHLVLKVFDGSGALVASTKAEGKRGLGSKGKEVVPGSKKAFREILGELLSDAKISAALAGQGAEADETMALPSKPAPAKEAAEPPSLPTKTTGRAAAPPAEPGQKSAKDRLRELDQLRKEGLITKKDYDRKKNEILKSL